jgi:hypothetical protein
MTDLIENMRCLVLFCCLGQNLSSSIPCYTHTHKKKDKIHRRILLRVSVTIRRGLDWILRFWQLNTQLITTNNYSAVANYTLYSSTLNTLGFLVFTSRILVTDFNTGNTTVSLNHTFQISLYSSTHKNFSSLPDFQLSTEISRFLHHLASANSGTLNPILWRTANSSQLSSQRSTLD